MTKKDIKFRKKVLGIYKKCLDTLDRYYEPDLFSDNSGIVRKVVFPTSKGIKQVKANIVRLKTELGIKLTQLAQKSDEKINRSDRSKSPYYGKDRKHRFNKDKKYSKKVSD